ncbi:hypothetical protein [Mangrovimonas futianensis]|uniref:hypothetical protein n=1 Tax=Mangrovimonas futianensis TaxID=2895523 RepID=UPI001E40F211|nr:hypothetical protein [Mangrovimonas futianensis]MCF1420691.1 hypothetical protein [Mangrovimonas futianensis]
MSHTIKFIQKVPLWKTILGVTFLLNIPLFILLFGILAIVPLVLVFQTLKRQGTEIDLNSKKYRNITSFLGLSFGNWQDLPEIDYVSVFATTETVTMRAVSAQSSRTQDIIKLNLFHSRNQKIEAYSTQDKIEAFDVAIQIAETLSADVLDATNKGDNEFIDMDHFKFTKEIKYIS